MIGRFEFGIDTQTISVIANEETEVIFGDVENQALITGFYMEDFEGNYVTPWKFTQPSFDRIVLIPVNTAIPLASITVYGGMIKDALQIQQALNILNR